MKKLIIILSFLLSGCLAEKPTFRGYEISAFATPWGAFYFANSEQNPMIRAHEMCHIRRMREYGSTAFILRYFSDSDFACSEERACSWQGPHPMCLP